MMLRSYMMLRSSMILGSSMILAHWTSQLRRRRGEDVGGGPSPPHSYRQMAGVI